MRLTATSPPNRTNWIRIDRLATVVDAHKICHFRAIYASAGADNRSALAYAPAYCVHTLEMNAQRGWGIAAASSMTGELLAVVLIVV